MKKIFGKNQVIITALAIMIAVAGYLSVTEENADNAAKLASTDMDEPSLAKIPDGSMDGITYDISEEDIAQNENNVPETTVTPDNGYDLSASGDIITDDAVNSAVISDEAVSYTEAPEAKETPAAVDSDQVADNQGETNNVGEAVMVSGTIGAEYFAQAKLSREQTRSRNKEILMEIVNSTTASKKQKDKAVSEVMELTSDSEKETAAETMLEAKGYKDSIVSIVEGSADVIVNAGDLTQKDIAQIEDIVKRKTDIDVSKIVITPVGVQ